MPIYNPPESGSSTHAGLSDLATSGHPANIIANTPAGGIAATDVQAAINELDTEKLALAGGSLTGALNEAKGANIASATTTDIGAATGNFVHVTGVTTITGLGTVQAGTRRVVEFDGILTLTHNATSLKLPTAANITTAAGDVAVFISEGTGNWKCTSYTRADGTALAAAGGGFEQLADVTLGAAAASLSSGTITAKKFLKIFIYSTGMTGSDSLALQFNADTGTNYSFSTVGTVTANQTQININQGFNHTNPERIIGDIYNYESGVFKWGHFHMSLGAAEAGQLPASYGGMMVGDWNDTASQITSIQLITVGANNISAGTRMTIFGSD